MEKRYYDAQAIINESLPFLTFIIIFSMVTGNFLEGFAENIIEKYLIILLILPAFINMSGSLASVFTSRITSSLYVGEIDEDFKPYKVLFLNMISMVLVAFTGFFFLAFIGIAVASIFFEISVTFSNFILIVAFSGIVTTILMMFIGLFAAKMTYSRGLDPDNFTIPTVTTIGDLIGTLLLIILIITYI